MIEIADSGANTHLSKQATPKMDSLIMENDMKATLPYGRPVDSKHVATLQLPGIIKQARHIHIFPKVQTDPIISLVVLCDDGCTITIDKQ